MVSACLAGLVTISKFILQGVAEVAVPLTSLVASTVTVLVSARVWQLSILSSHEQRSSNASLSDFEKAVMALIDGALVTFKQLIAPKSMDGIVYRGMSAFFFTAFLVAIFQPTNFLSLLLLVPPWEGRIDAAVAAWAPGLLFQGFSAFALACGADEERLSETVFKDLNASMVLTLLIQGLLLYSASAAVRPLTAMYLACCSLFAIFCALKHPPPRNLSA
jgi:hypothetical protein